MNQLSLKRILLLAGTSLILTGCYHPATNSAQSTPQPTPVSQQQQPVAPETTVTYTDQGFSPASVTVKAGTQVTFVNQSSSQMWVASAVHPTHQALPGFDQLQGAARNGSYSYAFDQVGTWKYHNHLSPTQTGTVVVE